ncbi:MAG TPA: oligosaccharide flippase family protein [Steroidobacter sp.]
MTLVRRMEVSSRDLFLRGVATVASGTAVSQAVIVLSSPILTRLYTPADFGVLGVYVAALSILTMVAGLRYQLAMPLPRSDGSAANILALAFALVVAVALATMVISVNPLGTQLADLANAPGLKNYLWLLPVGVLLCGLYDVLTYWAIRKKDFGCIARTKVQQSVGAVGVQVAMGLAQFGPLGLIIGHILGNAAGVTRLLATAIKRDAHALKRIRVVRILGRARRFKRFPLYVTWAGLAQIAGAQLPAVFFAAIFSPAVAGLYLLADRVTRAPIDLIGKATSQVFFSGAADARREGHLERVALSTFEGLTRVSVGPAMLLAVSAPELFGAVFGREWMEAGTFVRWLTPMLITSFIVAPLTVLHSVMEVQAQSLALHVTMLSVRCGALALGILVGQVIPTIAIFSILSALVYGMFGLRMLKLAGVPAWLVSKQFLREVFIVSPAPFVLWWLKGQIVSSSSESPAGDGTTVFFLATTLMLVLVLGWRTLPVLRCSNRSA